MLDLVEGEPTRLAKRGITLETCIKFKYWVGKFKGKTVQIANYIQDGQIVAQKIRTAKKDFMFLGKGAKSGLFGQHLWRSGGKMLVITEGEIDCLSVSQIQNNKWPVVSVPTGAQGALKSIKTNLEYLEKFEKVILMFDMDEPGQEAAKKCAEVLSPGKARIASLPLKDPNEMLLAGREAEVISAIWDAKEVRPDEVVSVMDVYEEAIKMPTMGLPWPWPSLTKLTYGINFKTAYYLGAGVGIGKTDWAKELESHIVNSFSMPVGVFMLEESVGRTLKGIAGKFHNKPFHDPTAEFSQQELEEAIKELDGKVYLYNHRGVKDWDTIQIAIRFMVHAYDIRFIFLDNLTAMVSHLSASEANDEINRISGDIASLVQELDIAVFGFSHLNAPKVGPPHERGGDVHESQFTGSRGLMRYGHYLFGIQRDKSPELSERERNTSTFVLLKDREYGNVGKFEIYYDRKTGTYLEPAIFEDESGEDNETGEEF